MITIKRLEFTDNFRNWKLNTTAFSDFNLLVGKSGTGKTRILNALRAIRSAGIGDVKYNGSWAGCEWEIELEVNGKTYLWAFATSFVEPNYFPSNEGSETHWRDYVIHSETLKEQGVERLIIDRSPGAFLFGGDKLPKLTRDTSAIALLNEVSPIDSIHSALKRMMFSESDNTRVRYAIYSSQQVEIVETFLGSITSLREATNVPIIVRAAILQKKFPERFVHILRSYQDIFPTITALDIGDEREFEGDTGDMGRTMPRLTFAIKEEGVEGWIVAPNLSSGMYKTLIHLFELELAPAGSVIVIDEIENSLGVNCLDEVVSSMLRRANDLQFIVTSHHPYVINCIPTKYWNIVMRKGAEVTVKDANEIATLQGKSAQDKFIRLINLREYEDSIQ